MVEVREREAPKSRVESLSDLIFGLALSIGALTLIGQPPSSFPDLFLSVLYYGFSFLILINVWFGYTRLMSALHSETRVTINLNILMLFLVSVEPYLFNQLFNVQIDSYYVTILYASDLAGLFLVQAFIANVISKENKTIDLQRHYRFRRNSLIFGAAIFLVSILPFFWELTIPIGDAKVHLTFLIWLIPLFQRVIRNVHEKRKRV
jgi:uncharacterized membrane protein